jgi:glycosyltransferase involved in cell wall biosynthesis
MRFASFVTTFNRPERLRRTLEITLAQTPPPDRLLVIDNGDPGVAERVVADFPDPRVAYHAMGENTGPAGAAAYGLERLAAEGFDWIGWGDDDTPPKTADAFERLLRLAAGGPADLGGVGAVGARFDWRRGELVRLADAELAGVIEVDAIGGGLQLILRREAVRTVGLPDRRLFFGFEDPEYCLRLRRAGYRLWVDGELMRSYRELAGRMDLELRRSVRPANPPDRLWRRYYVTRNYIHMMRRTFGRPDLARREAAKALGRTVTAWGRGPRYGWEFGKLQLRGVVDGYRGRLGRTVTPQAKVYTAADPQ